MTRGARYHFPDGVHMFSLGVAQGRGHARVLSLCVSVPEILGRSLFLLFGGEKTERALPLWTHAAGSLVWREIEQGNTSNLRETLCARARPASGDGTLHPSTLQLYTPTECPYKGARPVSPILYKPQSSVEVPRLGLLVAQ